MRGASVTAGQFPFPLPFPFQAAGKSKAPARGDGRAPAAPQVTGLKGSQKKEAQDG